MTISVALPSYMTVSTVDNMGINELLELFGEVTGWKPDWNGRGTDRSAR